MPDEHVSTYVLPFTDKQQALIQRRIDVVISKLKAKHQQELAEREATISLLTSQLEEQS